MDPIRTSRLLIRPFAESDLDAATSLLDECFATAPRQQRRDWLEWSVRNYRALAELHQPPYGDYAVVRWETNELIGSVGLVPSLAPFGQLPMFSASVPNGTRDRYSPEMGLFWATAVAHRNNGYAAEAAGAIAAFAFDTLRVARLVATTEHENAASIAVMRKIGMTIETNPEPTPHWFQVVGVLSCSDRNECA